MKQEYKLYFVDTIEKEVSDHKQIGHWTVVHQENLPKNENPMKAIWYFKEKRNPNEACCYWGKNYHIYHTQRVAYFYNYKNIQSQFKGY